MTDQLPARSAAEHLCDVTHYYRTRESMLGYALVLGGTKHFGYYRPGDNAWRLRASMRRMEDELAQRLNLPVGSKVLDAGSGMGDVARRLAETHGLDVTGIDILDFNVGEARRRAARDHLTDRLRFHEMDYAELSFPDQSFDGAYTMETLVHSDQVENVLRGFHRVLKPGGRLVHFEYSRSPESETSSKSARVLKEINMAAAMPAFQRLPHGELESLLTGAGFVDVESFDITEHMLPMLKVFAILGWPPYTVARLLGRPTKFINAMSGVEFYRRQDCWRYQVYVGRKA